MWGVPIDHESFNEVSNAQWMWYFYNYAKDQDDDFSNKRDLVEYLASFSEPQAVKKVRDLRAGKEQSERHVDDNISGTLERMFGKAVKFKDPDGKQE